MGVGIELTFDCVDAPTMATFWKLALGYEDEPPPVPFASRREWLASYGVPEDEGDGGAWLHDPDGVGPRLCILQVPEPKVAKNRLHMDIRVGGTGTPEERWDRIVDKVAVLAAAGATTLAEHAGHHVVMADPEGNEFCVC